MLSCWKRRITPIGAGGGRLQDLAAIDLSGLDQRLAGVEIVVACDVDNPLCGERAHRLVFGPQKVRHAPETVQALDSGLPDHFAAIAARDLGLDIESPAGAGGGRRHGRRRAAAARCAPASGRANRDGSGEAG